MSRRASPELPEEPPTLPPFIPTRQQRAQGIHVRNDDHPFGYRQGSSADLSAGRVTRSHAGPSSFGPQNAAANAVDNQPSSADTAERSALVRGNARGGIFNQTPEQTHWRNAQPSSSSSNSSTPPAKVNPRIRLVGAFGLSETSSESEGEDDAVTPPQPAVRPMRPGFARRTGVPERPIRRNRQPQLNAVGLGRVDSETEPSSVDTVIQKFPDLAVAKEFDEAAITEAHHPGIDKDDLSEKQADIKAAVEKAAESDSGNTGESSSETDSDKSDTEDNTERESGSTTDNSTASEMSVETKAEWHRVQQVQAERKVRFNLIGSIKRKHDEMEAEDGKVNGEQPANTAVSMYQPEPAAATLVSLEEEKDHETGTDTENEREIFADALITYSDDDDTSMPDFEHPPIVPKKTAAEIAMENATFDELVAVLNADESDNVDETADITEQPESAESTVQEADEQSETEEQQPLKIVEQAEEEIPAVKEAVPDPAPAELLT
ncbi:enolase-phosphatase E1-like [Paramacrobiotus metropolitanus]|uniref:enolase-phosphatase E1-like n=1 Tax=Paramacrobiotus metropolitanus TaxID=2943436 RepID=UPI002445C774|nr:enolase-phosphatase E1-like [Paramacrobiotus metropolitanus]